MAKKIRSNGKAEWVWEEANFAWELGPPPLVEETNEDDRGIVIMVYDKDRLSAPQVLLESTYVLS